MFKQGSILRRYYGPFAGFLLACNFAMAQNWVSSGSSGAPVIPFDALADGYVVPSSPTGVKTPLYTCRAGEREGFGLRIGRYTPGAATCDFSYGGLEISLPDFEFLVTSWQAESGGVIPVNAVVGGGISPRSLYICRGEVGLGPHGAPPIGPISLQLGEIGPGYGGCLVPYSGKGLLLANYQVLVAENPAMPICHRPREQWFRAAGRHSRRDRCGRHPSLRLFSHLRRGQPSGETASELRRLQHFLRRSGTHDLFVSCVSPELAGDPEV